MQQLYAQQRQQQLIQMQQQPGFFFNLWRFSYSLGAATAAQSQLAAPQNVPAAAAASASLVFHVLIFISILQDITICANTYRSQAANGTAAISSRISGRFIEIFCRSIVSHWKGNCFRVNNSVCYVLLL